ncbi:MAG: tRNA preQ1(34) S-adenosylmethionine ribosyltransferase-isomerase QueA [Planctomycetes bacterium]|nr:tRNA preQ1(34) S-adenosylmethionine ribosyltransferase-isomerase QueA [Planctomycetota bacterium]
MKLSDFDFELPDERIAQEAVEPRDAARLLAHGLVSGRTEHAHVRDLPRFLRRGDLLVVNDTRVVPARLCGARKSGGALDVLVLGPVPGSAPVLWRAFVKPGGRLHAGEEFELESGALRARAVARPAAADGRPGPEWHLAIEDATGRGRAVPALLEDEGRMPLPPYIRRARDAHAARAHDRDRYQTVFARATGAIAAPTAGLHFTPGLLAELAHAGVDRASVTLHVGLGTFQPVTAERVDDHVMHSEEYELSEGTVAAIERARRAGGRVVAVGTTSVRVLESACDAEGRLREARGSTSIFLTPGAPFRVVDVLFTNFHLPKSTLVMLVSAFAGRDRTLALYAEAIAREYRFFSYGDAMLLARRE